MLSSIHAGVRVSSPTTVVKVEQSIQISREELCHFVAQSNSRGLTFRNLADIVLHLSDMHTQTLTCIYTRDTLCSVKLG